MSDDINTDGPGRNEPRRSLREETRAAVRVAILQAAKSVFGSQGFQAAKMSDIAQTAGVAAGTLYNYFTSKEEIFQHIVEVVCVDLKQSLAAESTRPDPIDRLRGYTQRCLEFIESNGALYAIHVQLFGFPDHSSCRDTESQDAKLMRYFFDLHLAAIDEAKASGALQDYPSDVLCHVLSGICRGFIVAWLESERTTDLRNQTDTIIKIFCHGAST